MDHMASDMSHGGMDLRGSAAAGPSSTVEANDRLKVIQEKNTHAQRKIRQRQKEKLTSMNQQLADLEAQLLAVQMECKQLDVENEVLLRQAEEKEAELQREKTKLAQHRKQQQESGMQATDVNRPPEQGSSAGMSSDDASAAKTASDLHEEPILVIRSCPGQVFEVTKSVLEVFPRHQLENIYSTLLRTMSESLQRFEEAERMMKDAMLRTELSISQRASSVAELEGVMRLNHRVLENVVKDLVPLYCHAFRSHPKETYQMDVQAAAASRGPTGTLLSQDVQATLKMSSEQQQHVLNFTMRYLSAVKDCMDQRKSLHAKLSQNEAALLEWESVASWLASDALVNALQTTLAKEVDIYLEWSTYICLNVFSPPQTAKYLLSAPLRDLLQVCMSVVRSSHDHMPADHMSGGRMPAGASAMPRGPGNPTSAAPGMMQFPDLGGTGDTSQFPNLDVFRNSSNPRGF